MFLFYIEIDTESVPLHYIIFLKIFMVAMFLILERAEHLADRRNSGEAISLLNQFMESPESSIVKTKTEAFST